MKQILALTLFSVALSAGLAHAGSDGFTTMSVGEDAPASCAAPRPPADLNKSAYIRNGYRAILRIMAAEVWQETGSCTCFLTKIEWDEVILEAQSYITSDNPLVPFVVADLRIKADELLAERDLVCSN